MWCRPEIRKGMKMKICRCCCTFLCYAHPFRIMEVTNKMREERRRKCIKMKNQIRKVNGREEIRDEMKICSWNEYKWLFISLSSFNALYTGTCFFWWSLHHNHTNRRVVNPICNPITHVTINHFLLWDISSARFATLHPKWREKGMYPA